MITFTVVLGALVSIGVKLMADYLKWHDGEHAGPEEPKPSKYPNDIRDEYGKYRQEAVRCLQSWGIQPHASELNPVVSPTPKSLGQVLREQQDRAMQNDPYSTANLDRMLYGGFTRKKS